MRIATMIGAGLAALAVASAAEAKERVKLKPLDVSTIPPIVTIAAPPAPPPSPPLPSAQISAAVLRSGSIGSDDYPPSAMRMEEQGTVMVRYVVGVDGRVSDCAPINVPALPLLDQETCRLIVRRFRFQPALDETGTPVATIRSQNVTWMLPEPDREFLPGTLSVSFGVTKDGLVFDCKGSGASSAEGSAENFCAKLTRAEPALDKDGNPIAQRVTYRIVTQSVPIK